MSKKGNYIGGSTVVSRNSSFFREEDKNGLTLNQLKHKKDVKLKNKVKKSISNYINNIKLLNITNSQNDKHFEKVINIYLREIIILMFSKKNLKWPKKKYREKIFLQLERFGITGEMIGKCIDKHVSNSWKEKLKEE